MDESDKKSIQISRTQSKLGIRNRKQCFTQDQRSSTTRSQRHHLLSPSSTSPTFPSPPISLLTSYKCPFYVIANIPLCPFNQTTGSTEFWLGSHQSTAGTDQVLATPDSKLANAKLRVGEPECNILSDVLEARRKIRPPIQPVCAKGDIMLRDLRTWHAGMPNESDDYRIMLALGYKVSRMCFLKLILSRQRSRYRELMKRKNKRLLGIPIIHSVRNFPPVKQTTS